MFKGLEELYERLQVLRIQILLSLSLPFKDLQLLVPCEKSPLPVFLVVLDKHLPLVLVAPLFTPEVVVFLDCYVDHVSQFEAHQHHYLANLVDDTIQVLHLH